MCVRPRVGAAATTWPLEIGWTANLLPHPAKRDLTSREPLPPHMGVCSTPGIDLVGLTRGQKKKHDRMIWDRPGVNPGSTRGSSGPPCQLQRHRQARGTCSTPAAGAGRCTVCVPTKMPERPRCPGRPSRPGGGGGSAAWGILPIF
eukprot:gene21195-biopygen13175